MSNINFFNCWLSWCIITIIGHWITHAWQFNDCAFSMRVRYPIWIRRETMRERDRSIKSILYIREWKKYIYVKDSIFFVTFLFYIVQTCGRAKTWFSIFLNYILDIIVHTYVRTVVISCSAFENSDSRRIYFAREKIYFS